MAAIIGDDDFCRYWVSGDGQLVVEKWRGTVHHAAVLRHERAQMADPRITGGARCLCDLSLCSFADTDEHNVGEISAVTGERLAPPISKGALWTTRLDNYDKAKRYAEACARYGIDVQVFGDLEAACQWLGVGSAEVRRELASL